MRVGIAGAVRRFADMDDAHLQVVLGNGGHGAAAGLAAGGGFAVTAVLAAAGDGEQHNGGQQECENFLHLFFLLFSSSYLQGAGRNVPPPDKP